MALTQVDQGLLGTYAQYTGFKNRIINGAMMIDQRNAGASVTVVGEGYTLDRWYFASTQTNKLTCQQNAGAVTPPAGFKNYLGVTSSSAYSVLSTDLFALKYSIEGFNTADFGFGTSTASTTTLSFWVRSSLTGTFGASYVNNAFDRSYAFSYTINAANTWEYKTVTIPGDTTGTWVGATNGIGLRVYFNLGASSTYSTGTSNAWVSGGYATPTGATSVVGTNGATFYITGVQLEKGSTATSFDYRPYGTELALCQRYYYKKLADLAYGLFGPAIIGGTAIGYVTVQFPVPMRTSPSALEQSGTATDYRLYTSGATVCNAVPTLSTSTTSINALVHFNTAATMTAGNSAFGSANNNANAYLGWSAEL